MADLLSTFHPEPGKYATKLVMYVTDANEFRVPYSVFLMHRRKDLWGSDGQPTSVCQSAMD